MENKLTPASEKFEEYLKSIGGLINGHFPDRPNIVSRYYCECGDGWLPLIQELIEKLIAAGWNKEICQIKEKFAGLRFYTNGQTDECWDLIREYEEKSYNVCEWVQGYACCVATMLKLTGINDSAIDELFHSGVGSIEKAIAAGVHENDLEELKKYYK